MMFIYRALSVNFAFGLLISIFYQSSAMAGNGASICAATNKDQQPLSHPTQQALNELSQTKDGFQEVLDFDAEWNGPEVTRRNLEQLWKHISTMRVTEHGISGFHVYQADQSY